MIADTNVINLKLFTGILPITPMEIMNRHNTKKIDEYFTENNTMNFSNFFMVLG